MAVSSFCRIFAGKTTKQPNYDYQQSSHRENVNKCYRGGKSLRFTFLLTLALTAFAACSEDTPAAPNNETRTLPSAADSTGTLAIQLTADTAWADTIDVSFDVDTTTVTITVPDSITRKSAQEAASRRQ